jgi:hypothetical protein
MPTEAEQYNYITNQNEVIQNSINELRSQVQYYDNLSNFEKGYSDKLISFSTVLFYTYYALVLVLGYVLFLQNTATVIAYSFRFRIVLFLIVLFYPFISLQLKDIIVNTASYVSAFLTVRPHEHPKANHISTPFFAWF